MQNISKEHQKALEDSHAQLERMQSISNELENQTKAVEGMASHKKALEASHAQMERTQNILKEQQKALEAKIKTASQLERMQSISNELEYQQKALEAKLKTTSHPQLESILNELKKVLQAIVNLPKILEAIADMQKSPEEGSLEESRQNEWKGLN
jgi:SMC interacting uncharacterized protein involved in chromosome segregation